MSITELTPQDRKRGIRDITKKNPTDEQYKKLLGQYETKRDQTGQPWCFTCARRDFNKEVERVLANAQELRNNPDKPVREEDLKVNIDLDKYWQGFELVSENIKRDTTDNNDKHHILFENYRCPNGHTLSMNRGRVNPAEHHKKQDDKNKDSSAKISKPKPVPKMQPAGKAAES